MLKKILVVDMNYIGDALMTTPTLRMLREASSAPVDVIAGGSGGYGAVDALRGNPDIGRLIPRVAAGAFGRCRQLFIAVLTGYYDLVVVLPSIPSYSWAATLGGARNVLYVTPTPDGVHMAEHMAKTVAAHLGVAPAPMKMTFRVDEKARKSAAALLAEATGTGPLIGMAIGGTRPQKRWDPEAFAETARRLCSAGSRVALIGGPSDKALAGEIVAGARGATIADFTGRTSLAESAAIIEQCAALLTGDTGAMHIAAALEVPLVALFGSTDPAKTGPIGPGRSRVIYRRLACSPCNSHPTCGGAFHCMAAITPDEVVSALEQAMGRAVGAPVLKIVTS